MRRRMVVLALLVVTGGILGGMVFHDGAASARSLAQAVLVSNTPAQAVPVREQDLDANGNVKVHEQGTASVEVSNGAGKPIPVADVADPARQPYQISGTTQAGDGVPANQTCMSVPTGKLLVITYVDGSGFLLQTGKQMTADLTTAVNGTSVRHLLLFQKNETADYPQISSEVTIYAQPGSTWCMRVNRSFGADYTGTIGFTWSVSGYFVDA